MEWVNTENRVPIKSWCNDLDDGALEQANHLASLPFAHKHVALMPDAHVGYGMPIGGVIATKGVVLPNAVGVDVGCGVCATKILEHVPDTDTIKRLMSGIRKVIPVGFKRQKRRQDEYLPDMSTTFMPVIDNYSVTASKSLGTLGGGNHFIELQKDEDENLWVMVHSGSRNVGKQVCDHYNKVAKKWTETWYSAVDPKWDLAFLPLNTDLAESYLNEMQWCIDYAYANRHLILQRIMEVFSDNDLSQDCEEIINIAHNYASIENHFGKNVVVHRKGATLAREGTIGIIPGSQGTASYIVEGLGNPDSFMSCSHGAGRVMGRKQAQRELDLDTEIKNLDEKGVIHSIRSKDDLDEAPSAYKDIYHVMNSQKDLVKVVRKLLPVAVIKG